MNGMAMAQVRYAGERSFFREHGRVKLCSSCVVDRLAGLAPGFLAARNKFGFEFAHVHPRAPPSRFLLPSGGRSKRKAAPKTAQPSPASLFFSIKKKRPNRGWRFVRWRLLGTHQSEKPLFIAGRNRQPIICAIDGRGSLRSRPRFGSEVHAFFERDARVVCRPA
jgi:hypothetical protein